MEHLHLSGHLLHRKVNNLFLLAKLFLSIFEFIGYRAAVKMFDFSITKHGLPKNVLMLSYAQEVKMALKIRNVERHVVTIYGFAYDPARNFASIAMELGEDNLEVRVKDLHKIYETSKMINKDYISSIDRKNIWIQLVEIILVLHRYNIVS